MGMGKSTGGGGEEKKLCAKEIPNHDGFEKDMKKWVVYAHH